MSIAQLLLLASVLAQGVLASKAVHSEDIKEENFALLETFSGVSIIQQRMWLSYSGLARLTNLFGALGYKEYIVE